MRRKIQTEDEQELLVQFLLDRSGSMESCRQQTIDGFNEWLAAAKNDPKPSRFTMIQFDSDNYNNLRVEKPYDYIDVKSAEPLAQFQPNGGTPLFDAILYGIDDAKARNPESVLFVIMTDGGENTSNNVRTREEIARRIKELEDTGKWSFVYLGSNQDAWSTGSSLGLSNGNVATYAAATTKDTFGLLSQNYSSMRSNGLTATRSLFSAPTASAGSIAALNANLSYNPSQDILSSGNSSAKNTTRSRSSRPRSSSKNRKTTS